MHELLRTKLKQLALYLSKILFDILSIVKQATASIVLYGKGAQIFQKCSSRFKIQRVRKVTSSKSHT